MLLSTAYFPPVEYFALLARDMTLSPDRVIPSRAVLEACENYRKQTWRNRCRILSAGGVEILQVPIVHTAPKIPIREVRVDYSTPWVLRTERTLDAAYHTSAYFDYYRDDLFALLEAGQERLFDLNLRLLRFLLEKTGVAAEITFTDDFAAPDTLPDDWRYTLTPKRPNTILHDLELEKPYFQVFSGKYGFVQGLSVLDLLFNEGPDSVLYLKRL